MTVVVLLGATRAPARARRRRSSPSDLGHPARRHRRPVPGRRPRRRRRSGSRRGATWSAASSSPTTSRSGCSWTASASRDAADGRHPRRLPAQPRPGRGARRPRSRERGAQVDRAVEHRRPGRGARPPPVRPLGLPRRRPRLQRVHQPAAQVPGRCDLDGSPLVQRDGRQGRDDPGRDWPCTLASLRDVVDHYDGRRASCGPSTASSRSTSVTADLLAAVTSDAPQRRRAEPADVVTRKSRAEIERMRRAGRIVAEVLALVEDELKPGVTTGHLDRLAEAPHPQGRRDPVLQGLSGHQPAPAIPGQPVHLHRRRDRPRHPGRAASSATARSCRSTPARSSTAGTATPRGPSSSASRPRRSASSSTRPVRR